MAKPRRIGLRWGYRRQADGSLVPDRKEQAVTAVVRHMRAAGFTFNEIVDFLREQGVVGRTGAPLGPMQVLHMARGEQEAAELPAVSAQTRRAIAALPARGGQRRGRLPWGFRLGKDGKRVVRDRREVAISRAARKMREEGLTLQAIADALGERGMFGRKGQPLSLMSVFLLLKGEG